MATALAIGSIGASVYGARKQAKAMTSAQRSQEAAARRAEALAAKKSEEAKVRLNPFIKTGTQASDMQAAFSGALGPEAQAQAYADFKSSPGQVYLRKQGMKNLDNTYSASGVGGGTRLKAITAFNQDLAMTDFQNNFNRLQKVTDTGLSAAGTLSGREVQFNQAQAAPIIAAGNAAASGALGRARAFGTGLNGVTKAIGGYAKTVGVNSPGAPTMPGVSGAVQMATNAAAGAGGSFVPGVGQMGTAAGGWFN